MSLRTALCWAMVLAACSDPGRGPQRFSVVFSAALPEGMPLAGVRFWANGRELGASDTTGTLESVVLGREGQNASVAGICPPGYRGASEPRALRLQTFTPALATQRARLALTVHCEREERLAVLVVRSRLATRPMRVPVEVDGERIGETDDGGTAHLLVRVSPNASLRVMLDTAASPDASPQNPVRSFDVDESESILLFDQRFEPPPRRLTTHPSSPRRTHAPYRVE